ncbi:MAG: ribonuclease III [Xanthobacteraceae bacterium]
MSSRSPASADEHPAADNLAALEARLGHAFTDRTGLALALTHISAVTSVRGGPPRTRSYQRLEFLGDHVLGLVVSDMLFQAFPDGDEGDLSRRLAELVCEEACAEVALEMGVAPYIRLGSGEAKAGGRKRQPILADIAESVLAAVYLDGGFPAAQALVERFWRPRIAAARHAQRDPKTALQEWAQARGLPTPVYKLVERQGPDHSPEFRIAIELPGFAPVEGSGRSKQSAQKAAAGAFLEQVKP